MAHTKSSTSNSNVIGFIDGMRTEWSLGRSYVTGEVQQDMFRIIKRARKNYFSIYDKKRDVVTGRRKLFFPLTESMVEDNVKNGDLDTKDMQLRAKSSAGFGPAISLRHILFAWMERLNFGTFLNRLVRFAAIDGTVVVKVIKKEVKGRRVPFPQIPDLLNILFDPSKGDPNEGILERHIFTEDEFKKIATTKKWKNWEGIQGIIREFRFNDQMQNVSLSQTQSDVNYIEVWEYHGKGTRAMLKEFNEQAVTEEDRMEWLDKVHLIVYLRGRNKETANQILFAEQLKENQKIPYKIFRYREVNGRGHGKGIAEILFDLQSYLNELLNIRANTNRLKHTGLFTVRKGQGITQQMIASLLSGGVIPINRRGDIEELRSTDQKQSSYADEDVIFTWAQRATGNFQITSGEGLPASQPATTAVLSSRGAASGFGLNRENMGLFLKELFEDLIIPMLIEELTDEDVVRIAGDPADLKVYDKAVKTALMQKEADKFKKANGRYMNQQELDTMSRDIDKQFEQLGNERYNKIVKKSFNTGFNIQFFVTDEAGDPATKVTNLVNLIGILRQFEAPTNLRNLGRLIIDRSGEDGSRILQDEDFVDRGAQETPTTPVQSGQEQLTQATTLEGVGR